MYMYADEYILDSIPETEDTSFNWDTKLIEGISTREFHYNYIHTIFSMNVA